jgi:hypothetical protein
VHHHERVVVDVDDAGVWCDALRDFVSVVGCGQACSDVEELTDADFSSKEPYGAAQESAGLASDVDDVGERLLDLVPYLAVYGEVVFAVEPVVPYPGAVRNRVCWIRIPGRQSR